MKTLYFECNMGAAGDMVMAALLELHGNQADFLHRLNAVGIPGVVVSAEAHEKCGIVGTRVVVKVNGHEEASHDHHHAHAQSHSHDHGHGHAHNHDHDHPHDHSHDHEHSHGHGHVHDHNHEHSHDHSHGHGDHSHNSYRDIEHRIGHLNISDTVKKNALAVYKLIADAESTVHGTTIDQIHFHEVGEMDALADIVGVCMLMEELSPDVIKASPINVGSGHVKCSHGILPVPAPAAALILQGVPIYSDKTKGELCTPTGAALIKHFADEFCPLPMMRVSKIGYGMGTKNFEKANCVRTFIGDGRGE